MPTPNNNQQVKSFASLQLGFTLSEVLITLAVIGIIAALIIPPLVQSYQERQMVTGLLKFNSTLQQAVESWKNDIGCFSSAYNCLLAQTLPDNTCSNFDQISQFMKFNASVDAHVSKANVDWLPNQTLDYYGNDEPTNGSEGVSQLTISRCAYELSNGQNISIDVDPTGFWIMVDVNGKKPPNRMGKDTFHMTVGYPTWNNHVNQDVEYYAREDMGGICGYRFHPCKADNTNPTLANGASPTAYVLLYNKLPDFFALSQTVANFKP